MKRDTFIRNGLMGCAGLWLSSASKVYYPEPPSEPLPIELVREFVSAGHNDLNKVQQMLNKTPNLLYCRYDWGNGDYEEAIEGAGHVGNKDIANYLISEGARVNLFVLTMLGKTRIVSSILDEYPELVFAKGPHGFTLLHHAQVGGASAKELYDLLQEKGLSETKLEG